MGWAGLGVVAIDFPPTPVAGGRMTRGKRTAGFGAVSPMQTLRRGMMYVSLFTGSKDRLEREAGGEEAREGERQGARARAFIVIGASLAAPVAGMAFASLICPSVTFLHHPTYIESLMHAD